MVSLPFFKVRVKVTDAILVTADGKNSDDASNKVWKLLRDKKNQPDCVEYRHAVEIVESVPVKGEERTMTPIDFVQLAARTKPAKKDQSAPAKKLRALNKEALRILEEI